MELSNLIPHIEALIFASDKPLTVTEMVELLNSAFEVQDEADKLTEEQIDVGLQGIVEKYNSEFYPFEVRQSGGGWQFLTKKDYHKTVAQLNGEKFLKRLSAAALETLAIIAYKQPITKGEIEIIRGVSADYSIQKLLEKELIVISGRNEQLPGHPLIYMTSKSFMDYFGINSTEDLPKIKEVLPDQIIDPTPVHHTEFEQNNGLFVSDGGELINNDVNEMNDVVDANDVSDNVQPVDEGDDFKTSDDAEEITNEQPDIKNEEEKEKPDESEANNIE